MRINHNISALNANNQLAKTNKALDKSLEKLSSGFRINRAADDAAGMAISQKMKTQIAGLDRASQNAADGISVIQTAEGALTEVGSMLQRMRELSVQSANGANTTEDRTSIQAEIDELNEEIQRISDTTEFNKKALLNGDIDQQSYSNTTSVNLISSSDAVLKADYKIQITQDPRQAVLIGGPIANASAVITAAQAGTININGTEVEVKEGDTVTEVYEKIRSACDTFSVDVFASNLAPDTDSPETAGYKATELINTASMVFVSREYGSSKTIEVTSSNTALNSVLGLSTSATAKGVDAKANKAPTSATNPNGFNTTATIKTDGNKITITDSNNFEMVIEVDPNTVKTVFIDAKTDGTLTGTPVPPATGDGADGIDVTITVLEAGPMELQIGASEGQTMDVRIPKVTPKTLGIDSVNLRTEEGSQAAITAFDNAISQVTAIRAKLGAYQNRLEHSIANLDESSENMSEALSRIEDVDMAEEMATYTQKNVLAQAGTSMLAQANERPQNVLSLLQG